MFCESALMLRYGNHWVEFKPDHRSIEIRTIDQLEVVIPEVIKAVRTGELDQALKKAAKERRVKRRSKNA